MIVTVSGLSGLTNAYVSVLSAVGSCEIRGASRWLDASACGSTAAAESSIVPISVATTPTETRRQREKATCAMEPPPNGVANNIPRAMHYPPYGRHAGLDEWVGRREEEAGNT